MSLSWLINEKHGKEGDAPRSVSALSVRAIGGADALMQAFGGPSVRRFSLRAWPFFNCRYRSMVYGDRTYIVAQRQTFGVLLIQRLMCDF